MNFYLILPCIFHTFVLFLSYGRKQNEERESQYDEMLLQCKGLIEDEDNLTGILANVSALMRDTFGDRFFWAGFYLVSGDELILGPFQGSVACYRIKKGRGVCGTSWQENRSIVVPDVDQFPGHIACSSLSRSEIVVPITVGGDVVAVIDIDSHRLNDFDETDRKGLERLATLLSKEIGGLFRS